MASVNKVILVGNLGKDPESRFLPDGGAVCNFTMATTDKWKDKSGEQQERTEWHRISTFAKLAEICGEYLKKGSQVYVEGRLQTRSWDDQQSGQKRYKTEVNASDVQFIDSRQEAGVAGAPATPVAVGGGDAPAGEGGDIDPDDIPF